LEFAIRKSKTDPWHRALPAALPRPCPNRAALHVVSSAGHKKQPNLTLAHCARESRGRRLWTDITCLSASYEANVEGSRLRDEDRNSCGEKAHPTYFWCQSIQSMSLRDYFPTTVRIGHALTGRTARRIYLTFVVLLLVLTTVIRVRAFLYTRKIQAVIFGLSKLHIDETTEEEVVRTVPYLVRGARDRSVERNVEVGDVDSGVLRGYYFVISNDSDWKRFATFAERFSGVTYSKYDPPKSWIYTIADLFGYRYVSYSAGVTLLDGKVSSVRYEIGHELGFPRANIVSVASVHGYWVPRQRGFEVPSTEDENPSFDVRGNDRWLRASYSPDASVVLRSHLFQVDLSCLWGLIGCRHPRQIAPLLWKDRIEIEAATIARLQSNDPCPDRILAGRVRYLPDVGISLLEPTGYESKTVNEEGLRVNEFWTHYKVIEVLRGRPSDLWESVRSSTTVPYPGDYSRRLPNMASHLDNPGGKELAFSNINFDSCRLVPATPSAVSMVQNAIPSAKRVEDEGGGALQ
jgi:hypothetical protein